MTEKLLLLLFLYTLSGVSAQHSPYSLQDAVDALHRHEAQLALRENFNPQSRYIPSDEEYWGDEPVAAPSVHINRHQLNKLLAKYLTRDDDDHERGLAYEPDFDDDNYIQEEKKRSFFRERGGKYDSPYSSVFRERELAPYETPELAEDFLREVERERELEQEEKYKEALQRLWDKYQEQESQIKEDLFDDEKKKRQMLPFMGPPMERKRSYPVLPWLPASRKKRFPVTKRSPPALNQPLGSSSTDEKVARDLQAIFGEETEEKKKRSSGPEPSTTTEEHKAEKKSSETSHTGDHSNHSHSHHNHEHGEDEHEESESDEHDHEHDHEHYEDDDDDHDFDDDEDEDRKKKREISAKKKSNQEVVKEDQIIPGDLNDFRKKKSIQWSKYFGMDRRKKSAGWYMKNDNEVKKRSTSDSEQDDKRKKKSSEEEKLENMNNKLKTIEDLIIDETVKYTGAHEGISDPDEIRQLKDHVVSRLATAYSLEKMRRALDKLRQSVDDKNHLERNEIESDKDDQKEKEKEKRVAVKKEKVEFDNNQHSIDAPSSEKSHEVPANDLKETDEDKKKKKKRSGIHRYQQNDLGDFEEELGAGHFEPINDVYLGSKNYEGNQCPLLDTMTDRCRGIDLLSGDVHQELLPVCGIHQLCYLCGTSQTACDFQYLSEADSICGHNNDCQSAARAALMILRGAPGVQLGPRECMRNPCLYRAIRDIGL